MLAVAGLLTANHYRKLYLARPVIPTAPLVTKPDTTTNRPDTVKVVDPALLGRISALQAEIRALKLDTTQKAADSCFALLAKADTTLDSLQSELLKPPEVTLTLTDSTLPYLWPTVRYEGIEAGGISQWGYRFFEDKWPREEKPAGRGVGRVGVSAAVQTFTRQVKAGARVRVKQNLILETDLPLSEPGLWVGVSVFVL